MIGAFLLAALGLLVLAAGTYYSRTAATACEVTLPFAGSELPMAEVRAALERMGCVVSDHGSNTIAGFLSSDGVNWGQEVTVTAEPGRLRVRSVFSGSQVFGARKNQENVDRFKAEWERRKEVEVVTADPAVQAATEAKAREVARSSLWGGGLALAAGLALLLVAFLAPSRESSSGLSSRIRFIGLALIPLAYGLPRVLAAVSRLRK